MCPQAILFICFLVALGLGCCMQAFSSCSRRGLHSHWAHGLLVAVASLVAEHGLERASVVVCGLSSGGILGLVSLWYTGC